jgi:hypothetical protein
MVLQNRGRNDGSRDGTWIYTPACVIIGWVDDQDKGIYSQSGETLGYLQP